LKRFLREARAAAQLDHPNTVRIASPRSVPWPRVAWHTSNRTTPS
jgi:hypothetical protein